MNRKNVTSNSAAIKLFLCHTIVRLVLYSAILIPEAERLHSKRLHKQSKVDALIVKYFIWIVGLHTMCFANVKNSLRLYSLIWVRYAGCLIQKTKTVYTKKETTYSEDQNFLCGNFIFKWPEKWM